MGKEKNAKDQTKVAPDSAEFGCCKIDALVSVDGRGQLVLPKDLRDKARIQAGDKLAVVSWEKNGEVCCITLIKADDFAGSVRNILGPFMKGVLE